MLLLFSVTVYFYPQIAADIQKLQAEKFLHSQSTSGSNEDANPEESNSGQDTGEGGDDSLLTSQEGEGESAEAALGTDDTIIASISIPAMNVELPVRMGATEENLARGAAIVEGTGLPQGGLGTNCVIAAHRGYRGIAYFREIQLLEPGDVVYLTNSEETLTYVVESIRIIDPDDTDSILPQEGVDKITLLTCHPYRSGGKYRYLVYCVRSEGESSEESGGSTASGQDANEGNTAGEETGITYGETVDIEEVQNLTEKSSRLEKAELLCMRLFPLLWAAILLSMVLPARKIRKRK